MSELDNEKPDHWENDQLNRYEFSNRLREVIRRLGDPAVILLNHKYGVGKSYFLERFVKDLNDAGHFSFLYNAWANDFTDMPAVSFYSAFSREIDSNDDLENFLNVNLLEYADALITGVSKSTLLSLPSVVTRMVGIGSLRDIGAQTESTLSENKTEYRALNELIRFNQKWDKRNKFKEKFGEVVSNIVEYKKGQKGSKKTVSHPKVIIAIDELDRCHPDFSISLLEEIKHLFRTGGIIFVIAADKKQLKSSAETIVGRDPDVLDGYLRKYFDLEVTFPEIDLRKFCQIEFDEKIDGQQEINEYHKSGNVISDLSCVNDAMAYYGKKAHFNSDLRTIKRIYDRLKVCSLFAKNHIYFPKALSFLIFLKTCEKKEYIRFKEKKEYEKLKYTWGPTSSGSQLCKNSKALHKILKNDDNLNCELNLIQHSINDLEKFFFDKNSASNIKFENENLASHYLYEFFTTFKGSYLKKKTIKDYLINLIEYQQ